MEKESTEKPIELPVTTSELIDTCNKIVVTQTGSQLVARQLKPIQHAKKHKKEPAKWEITTDPSKGCHTNFCMCIRLLQ